MYRNYKKFIYIISFLSLILLFNFRYKIKSHQLDLASQSAIELSFQKIPCPTEKEVSQLIKDYNITISFDNFNCDHRDLRTALVKSLSQISNMNSIVPSSWGNELQLRLKDIKSYIKQYVRVIKVDPNLSNSTVVSAYPADQVMELTHRIRELYLIELISMLFHEMRHMESANKIHVRCGAGDMRGVEAACDEIFTLNQYDQMGSYNTEVLFLAALALYNQQISDEEKSLAAYLALKILGTRFNNFRDNTAVFQDVIVGLDNLGHIQIWHPFLKAWIKVPIEVGGDPILRIEPHPDAFSLSIFFDSGAFRVWNLREGLRETPAAYRDLRVQDADRVIVPSLNNDVHTSLIVNGQFNIVTYPTSIKQAEVKKYPFLSPQVASQYHFERLIFGLFTETFLLTKEGKLVRTNRSTAANDLIEVDELNRLGPWLSGSVGVVFEDIYFINKAGELFQLIIKNKKDISFLVENEFEPESYQLQKIYHPIPAPLMKYAQGAQGEYFLSQAGNLFLKNYTENKAVEFGNKKFKDFAIIKTVIPLGFLENLLKQKNEAFSIRCGVKNVSWDPLLYKGMGFNETNELVFSDFQNQCLRSGMKGTSFKFVNSSQFGERHSIPMTSNGINFKSNPKLEVR
ncbi:MAG: hypothetical protein ACK5V3_01555 [Bdellovibrionales bacterium]